MFQPQPEPSAPESQSRPLRAPATSQTPGPQAGPAPHVPRLLVDPGLGDRVWLLQRARTLERAAASGRQVALIDQERDSVRGQKGKPLLILLLDIL